MAGGDKHDGYHDPCFLDARFIIPVIIISDIADYEHIKFLYGYHMILHTDEIDVYSIDLHEVNYWFNIFSIASRIS